MSLDLSQWSLTQFQSFLLILVRVAPILFMMPVLGSPNLPALLKAGFSLLVSLMLWPVIRIDPSVFPADPYRLALLILSETLVGFLLGLSVKLVFSGIQLAGEWIGIQMGLSMVQIVDPQSDTDTTLIAQWNYLLGLLIFLAVDGHHWFFRALVQSFHLFAPGGWVLRDGLYHYFLQLSGKMFSTAIRIVAPITAILVFVQIALGIIARTVPQVNVLITSFPLTIGLGLIFLCLSVDVLWPYLRILLEDSSRDLVHVLLPIMR